MMKQIFTLLLTVISLSTLWGQEIRLLPFNGSEENISLSQRQRMVESERFTRASSCGPDTILYVNYKRRQGSQLSIGEIFPSQSTLSTFGQWYPAPSPMEVTGVSMFGFVNTLIDTTLTINVAVLGTGADSIPNSVIYQEDFTIDTAISTKYFNFAQPVSVDGSYAIAVTNLNDSAVAVVLTDPRTSDGRGEDLALGAFPQGGGLAFNKASNFFQGGFNADFLIRPIVQYDFDVDFAITDDCLVSRAPTIFENNSSGVLFSRFYNFDVLLDDFGFGTDSTFEFFFGDGSGAFYPSDTTFQHTFFPTDSNSFEVYGSALYFGMANVLCFDDDSSDFQVEANAGFTLAQDGDSVSVTSTTLDSVVYDYGDGSPETGDTTHVYSQVGSYTVTQTAFGCGENATTTETITISTASLDRLPAELVRIFPNPSKGLFTVQLQGHFTEAMSLRVNNLMGQEIARATGRQAVSLDLSDQAAGVYLLQGRVGDQVFSQTLRLE